MLLREFLKNHNYYYMYIRKKDKIINIEKSTGINIDDKLKKRSSVERMISDVFKNKHLIKSINNKKLKKYKAYLYVS